MLHLARISGKEWFVKRCLLLIASLAMGWGCGPLDRDIQGPSDRSVYPEGPYGKKEGEVLADLAFTSADDSPHSLGQIFADEKNRVLLLTSVAGWCVPCIDEQPKLAGLHQEFASRGLVVMAAMFEDADLQPATTAQVRDWKAKYKLPYSMVLDSSFALGPYYYTPRTPPLNILVDVDDMKILKITAGFDEQLMRSLIQANLPK